MNIIICGAGQVGYHAAEVLAEAGNNITVIDTNIARIRHMEDSLDVGTLAGDCSYAHILRQAGCEKCDLLIAATNFDEANLMTASIAKGIGARRCIARVHHRAYFESQGLDYAAHFKIDKLICPEFSTAQAIAKTLRNPGAVAIENFARGRVEMQDCPVTARSSALGQALADIHLPSGTRVAAIRRGGTAFLPEGSTVIQPDDHVVLVGNAESFEKLRSLFEAERRGQKRVVIMGGPPMAVWLCRALHDRGFSIRLFETDRARAEELADKLDWVTVLHADPTDRAVFDEEHLERADAFVALLDDDEHNILGSAWAKSLGVAEAIAVVQRPNYFHMLAPVGIDRPFSPRRVAVSEIMDMLDDSALKQVATLAEGALDVYQVRIGQASPVVGKMLREVKTTPHWLIAAVRHIGDVRVPTATDRLAAGDTVLAIGRSGAESRLKELFGVR